jgi:hydroxylysine kinase
MITDNVTARDMRFNPPTFAVAELAEKVANEYGLTGQWSPLTGERDQNFRLGAEDGQNFVVKIAGPDENPDVADFQIQALRTLETNSPQIPVPRIVRDRAGNSLNKILDNSGRTHILRVVTYLDGIPYGEGDFPDAQGLQNIGGFQAEVVDALANFEHKASRHFMPWNLSNGIAVSESLWESSTDDVRSLAAPLLPRLRHEILPKLNACQSQVIHNDAHPYNLLRANTVSQDVAGLIDFGDLVHAPVINDLAVMATSFHRPGIEDLDTVENLLIGFHRRHPLSGEEVSLLWDAMTLRVLITILLSDIKLNMMDDPEVQDERMEACAMLETICHLDHRSVVNRLMAVCGV